MIATTIGIDVPADFPAQTYNDVHSRVWPRHSDFVEPFRHYAGAWNAVAIRFRSLADSDQNFQQTLVEAGSPLNRYSQEVTMFLFFGNSVATLDSLAYGLYAIGAMVDPKVFVLTAAALRNIQLHTAGKLFTQTFPSEPLGKSMLTSATDATGQDLREIRNALSHRASSTRTFEMSPSPESASCGTWRIDHLQLRSGAQALSINTQTTSRYRQWLAAQLETIIGYACSFVYAKL